MRKTQFLRSRASRRANPRALRPHVDSLEGRLLLYATLGGGWTYGSRITYSFAPDGTNVGGVANSLDAKMQSLGISSQAWKDAFRKAAALWQNVANVNLVEVSDDGSPYGAAGNQQGDTRFGDIRIAGVTQGMSGLAMSFLPPPTNGGTLAGDILMNTAQAWKINNDFDVQTVALHEIGHALGLDHSAVGSAVMYAAYNGMKQSPTSDDIDGIRAVFGPRQADIYDAAGSNGNYTVASNLGTVSQAAIAGLDITSSADMDWYVVTAPSTVSGTLTVTMQSGGLSSLSPKLTVFNQSLQTIGTAAAANVYGATVVVSIANPVAGQKYYVRAQAANGGAGNAGAYGLLINFAGGSMAPIAPPYTVVASQPDQGGGSAWEVLRAGRHRQAVAPREANHTLPSGPLGKKRAGSPRRPGTHHAHRRPFARPRLVDGALTGR